MDDEHDKRAAELIQSGEASADTMRKLIADELRATHARGVSDGLDRAARTLARALLGKTNDEEDGSTEERGP